MGSPVIGELDQFTVQDLQAPDVDEQQIATKMQQRSPF